MSPRHPPPNFHCSRAGFTLPCSAGCKGHIPPPAPARVSDPSPINLISSPSCCVLQYYEDEGDSEMSGAHPDEEVAVTKRGRAVKLPAKYKAEVCPPPHLPPPSPTLRRRQRPSPIHTDWVASRQLVVAVHAQLGPGPDYPMRG